MANDYAARMVDTLQMEIESLETLKRRTSKSGNFHAPIHVAASSTICTGTARSGVPAAPNTCFVCQNWTR